jgi:hypothetical protein
MIKIKKKYKKLNKNQLLLFLNKDWEKRKAKNFLQKKEITKNQKKKKKKKNQDGKNKLPNGMQI